MITVLTDADQRARIGDDTAATLFVNAGAGSGKTTALVNRVTTLVLRDGIRLSRIGAVTFTEKAGAELRDRLRAEFETRWRAGDADRAAAAQALDDLDGAAIGTLHAFAQRILTEHPIEAGLPPIIEVLDEVGSSVAFEERWSELQSALLDDDDIAEPLLIALALGMKLTHVRSLALLLGKDWDLIDDRVLTQPPPQLHVPDLADLQTRARTVAQHSEHCTDSDDKLLAKLRTVAGLADLLTQAPDLETRLMLLAELAELKFGRTGRASNWRQPVEDIRTDATDLAAEAGRILADILDNCLRHITTWVARQVLHSASSRRAAGKLEFHDLLVLARDLLRRDREVRAALSQDYQRLLLDEFQDTDPIQIELAARICGGADAAAPRWQDIDLPAGRLFVVGDPKQSIYRFRRASIATYLDAEATIGDPVGLTTNFRTVRPVLDWVNTVFAQLITAQDSAQPAYVPLACHRDQTGSGPAVTILGAQPHTDLPRAAAAILREREATDVAAVIQQALKQRWQVYDEQQHVWRAARPDDIAVLVPARTSLPFLEDALEDAQVPYRAEASSLVYQASEVRDLLAAARAIADSSDNLSLVTALRSPLFGCGDDDLWRWKNARGTFTLYSQLEDTDPLATGPVGTALTYLRQLHHRARWLAPSEILATIATDTRMFEVAATGPRARDSWRRLRFVIDQARAWSEISHGGLRAYLAWAAHQGQELSRVAEAVLPETDTNSVHVMTIHAAKGLEFPIVILSGMTAQTRTGTGVALLWPAAGGYAVRLKKAVQTGDFDVAAPIDEQMDSLEKRRLLYVAATRARDHLVVSLHRAHGSNSETAAKLIADAGGVTAASATALTSDHHPTPAPRSLQRPAAPPPYQTWLDGVQTARQRSRASAAISASGLEGTEPEIVLDTQPADGLAKGARDLQLPPWTKGRYGSAVGRAVHAVLQSIDLATGAGLDGAVAAQSAAEGVTAQQVLVDALVRSALAADIINRAAAREHWRETYVGTRRDDGTILEGYVDLIYREDDGSLAIVDYKTDAVPAAGIPSRLAYYTPQMTAYRDALHAATGAPVTTTLLFLSPTTSSAVPVHTT